MAKLKLTTTLESKSRDYLTLYPLFHKKNSKKDYQKQTKMLYS